MIVGIGTDLVEIRRMRDMMDRHRGLERIFTKNELVRAKGRAETLHMDRIHVSITDTKKYAQAFVIGECL